MKKKILCLILCVALMLGAVPVVSAAQEIITDEFRYTLTDTYAVVTGPGSGMESVTEIPVEIRGLPVREIVAFAFWRNTYLTEITIPDSVTVFGNSAFRECKNLQAVHYSGTVVYTGQKAYYFEDDAKISKWAWDYVYMCQATGLVQGKNGNVFDPQGFATRAEVATILHNLHSKYMLIK